MRQLLWITTFLVSATPALAQVIFQSPLEAWTAGVPDGLIGPHTDFPLEQLLEEPENVHGGLLAMRLQLGILSEKRITTGPVTVLAGQLYNIRFWLRGNGRIRTSVYDGRAEASGYAPYNSAVVVNDGTNWQLVVQTVYTTVSSSEAEFVFAVEGTSTPAYLVIDDITITRSILDPPTIATIAEIQTTSASSGASPLNFQFVRTNGIVTGIGADSYFIQDGPGPWNGIQVRDAPAAGLALGDSVTVMGTVQEVEGLDGPWEESLTQLIVIEQLIVHSTEHTLPPPSVITAFDAEDEQWEGVLVKILDLECLAVPTANEYEWAATSWQGNILVDDLLYLYSPTIGAFYTITGIAHYYGNSKILARSAADFETGVGLDEIGDAAIRVFPNPVDDMVTLDHDGVMNRIEYTLHDVSGRLIKADVISHTPGTIKVDNLSNGLYLMTLLISDEVQSTRIIVQH